MPCYFNVYNMSQFKYIQALKYLIIKNTSIENVYILHFKMSKIHKLASAIYCNVLFNYYYYIMFYLIINNIREVGMYN